MKKAISLLFLLIGLCFLLSDLSAYYESHIANQFVLKLYKEDQIGSKERVEIKSQSPSLLQGSLINKEQFFEEKATNQETINQEVLDKDDSTIDIIQIPSLDLEYPIMLGKDNLYYLNHDPVGNKNKYGSIFWDYKGRPLIFGHNGAGGLMFGKLKRLKGGEEVYINNTLYKVNSINLVKVEKVMDIKTLSLITCHGDSSIRLVVSLEKVEQSLDK